MSNFLNILEEFDPQNTENPKWKLVRFLKQNGVHASPVRNTDMVYIDTGDSTIVVRVSDDSEEAEDVNIGATTEVDSEVERLASDPRKDNVSKKAQAAYKKRQQLAKKAVDTYSKKTNELQKSIRNSSSNSSSMLNNRF